MVTCGEVIIPPLTGDLILNINLEPDPDIIPQDGGLVVGNVTDANTGLGLNMVSVSGDDGQQTKTVPTPWDPQVEDGFYWLFSPEDTHVFTSTRNGYGLVVTQVNIIPGDTVRLDFSLPAGRVRI
jgi:hypothetical protein